MLRSVWPAILAGLMLVAQAGAGAIAIAGDAVHGIDPANMDLSYSPRDDFYLFANGGWLARTEIPDDKSSYGTFTELYDLTVEQLLEILAASGSGDPALIAGSDQEKAVRMWQQGVDVATRNALGLDPIAPILGEIAAIADFQDYNEFQSEAMFKGVSGSLPLGVSADLRDSGMNAVYMGGPWLGLPNRDYYLEDENADVQRAYVETNGKLLERTGKSPDEALASAQAVYDLEHALAETTLTREEAQNPELSYNPATIDEIAARYPAIDWFAYLDALDIAGATRIIVTEEEYLDQLGTILAQTPIETLRDYLRLQLLWNFSNNLDLELEETAFAFLQELGGQPTMPPIEERALGQVSGLMGDALGKLYVAEHFPPEAKLAIGELVDNVVAAFRARLERNEWMTPETRHTGVGEARYVARQGRVSR